LERLYAAIADPGQWPAALECVADYVGGTGAFLIRHDFTTRQGALINARLRDDLVPLYLSEYFDNPYSTGLVSRPVGTTVISTLADPADVRRSAFYADILQPQCMTDQITFKHVGLSAGGNTGGLSVTLNDRQADWVREPLARFNRLVPHMQRALDLSLQISREGRRPIANSALLSHLPQSAFLVDGHGKVVDSNWLGEKLLARDDGLAVGPDRRLRTNFPEDEKKLQRSMRLTLAHVAHEQEVIPDAFTISRPSTRTPLLVVVTALLEGPFAIWAGNTDDRARLLIQIFDSEQTRSVRDILRKAYGLTHAEARIAELVGSGMTAPAAARFLGVSTPTARTHLWHCFDKMMVRSQAGLAALIAQLPASVIGRDRE